MKKQTKKSKEETRARRRSVKSIIALILIVFMLYTTFQAVTDFYTGFHNLDTAQNFLRLGHDVDINMEGVVVPLETFYAIGLAQMMGAFKWILFEVILGIIVGWLIK